MVSVNHHFRFEPQISGPLSERWSVTLVLHNRCDVCYHQTADRPSTTHISTSYVQQSFVLSAVLRLLQPPRRCLTSCRGTPTTSCCVLFPWDHLRSFRHLQAPGTRRTVVLRLLAYIHTCGLAILRHGVILLTAETRCFRGGLFAERFGTKDRRLACGCEHGRNGAALVVVQSVSLYLHLWRL